MSYLIYGFMLGFLLNSALIRLVGLRPMDDFIYIAMMLLIVVIIIIVKLLYDRKGNPEGW